MGIKEHNDHLKDVLLNIEKIFESVRFENKVLAVPFFITAKEIKTNCAFCYAGDKVLADGTLPKFCAHPDYLDIYKTLHAKIVNCTNCQLFINEE